MLVARHCAECRGTLCGVMRCAAVWRGVVRRGSARYVVHVQVGDTLHVTLITSVHISLLVCSSFVLCCFLVFNPSCFVLCLSCPLPERPTTAKIHDPEKKDEDLE